MGLVCVRYSLESLLSINNIFSYFSRMAMECEWYLLEGKVELKKGHKKTPFSKAPLKINDVLHVVGLVILQK